MPLTFKLNLPFYAGQGMGKEKALQKLAVNTAKILGIDNTHGSLTKGTIATLFISLRDAIDMLTNILSRLH